MAKVRIGLDLGSSKAAASVDVGRDWFNVNIPAYVGKTEGTWENSFQDYIQVRDGGEYKFVGRAALEQSGDKKNVLLDNKMNRSTIRPLLHAVLGSIAETLKADSLELDIVATLPFDASTEQRDQMQKLLAGTREIDCIISGASYVVPIKVGRIHLASEGLCSWMNYVLDDYGQIKKENLAAKKVLVGSLGLYHLNLVMVDGLRLIGRPISRSVPYGLSIAHEALCRKLSGGQMWEVDELARKGEIDGGEAFSQLADQVNNVVDNMLSRMVGRPDLYYWTGGGGVALYKWLKQEDKMLSPSPVMDDAEGARKLAATLWHKVEV